MVFSSNQTGIDICQKVSLDFDNCESYSNFDYCVLCKNGYYLQNGICLQNPTSQIQYCVKYASLNKCLECFIDYHPANSETCQKVEQINNCHLYSTSSQLTQCLQCENKYYLLDDTNCVQRQNSIAIQNCKKVSIKEDKCEICQTGYQITSDGLKCTVEISFCIDYEESSIQTNIHQCKICQPGYYLIKNEYQSICMEGGVQNCYLYGYSQSSCLECDSGYFLTDNSECIKHLPIADCLEYSKNKANVCTKCRNGYFPFQKYQICINHQILPNCKQYNSSGTMCIQCIEGYYVNNQYSCSIINENNPKCISADSSGKCTSCLQGYVLFGPDNICTAPFDYIKHNCYDYSFSDLNLEQAACLSCNYQNLPVNFQNQAVCVNQTQLSYKGIQSKVDYCIRYSNESIPLCLACSNNLSVNCVNNLCTCLNECPQGNIRIKDNLDGKINFCVPNNSFNQVFQDYVKSVVRVSLFMEIQGNKLHQNDYRVYEINTDQYQLIYDNTLPLTLSNPYDPLENVQITPNVILQQGFEAVAIPKSDMTTLIADCLLYYKIDNIWECYRCQWGKHIFDNTVNNNRVQECINMPDCLASTKISNINNQLQSVLSCHYCDQLSTNKYLHIYWKLDSNGNKIQSLLQSNDTSQSTFSIQCSDQLSNIPQCLIHTTLYNNANTLQEIACLACQQNYKPTFSENGLQLKITSCTLISQSQPQTDTSFILANATLECLNDVKNDQFYAFDSIFQINCVNVITQNCYIGNKDNKMCEICKQGYFLNKGGYCEKLISPFCNTDKQSSLFLPTSKPNNVIITDEKSQQQVRLYYTLAQTLPLFGCYQCQYGYYAIMLQDTQKNICIESSFLINKQLLSQTPSFVLNCNIYQNIFDESGYYCSKCIDGFSISSDNKHCIQRNDGCNIVQSDDLTKCQKCGSDRVNVNGICQKKAIHNCTTFVDTIIQTSQQCQTCFIGYFLSSVRDKCTLGLIINCQTYQQGSGSVCLSCIQGFTLIELQNNNWYCYPIDKSLNCLELEYTGLHRASIGLLSCSRCLQSQEQIYGPKLWSNITSNDKMIQTVCMQALTLPNCIKYDSDNDELNKNSFKCIECEPDYYYNENTNQCVKRQKMSLSCQIPSIKSDSCNKCKDYYFLEDDGYTCTHYPTGIYKCKEYLNEYTCQLCFPYFYLSNNGKECIPSKSKIDNCIIYSADNVCSKCDLNYFLISPSECKKAIAKNCFTFESINKCASCDPYDLSLGLQTSNGITNCVFKNIDYCITYTSNSYIFECYQCQYGYYANDKGICLPISKIIPNCKIYQTSSLCQKCENSYILTLDQQKCLNIDNENIDSNCQDYKMLYQPSCAQCMLGYYFEGGICVKCPNYLSCYQCNPINNTDCIVCKSGYYMSSQGNCTQVIDSSPQQAIINTFSTISKSLQLRLLIFLLLMFQ